GGPALVAGLSYAAVLAAGAGQRLAGWDADPAMLYVYDAVVAGVVLLVLNLMFGRWTDATVADLVVGLGEREGTSLRAQVSRALGDPSLVVGYWIPEQDRYVDDAGRPIELPTGGQRVVTEIDDRGEKAGVLIHDPLAIDDPRLVGGVASAARLAVANARLQAEVRARVAELTASRRRIVEAGDAQGRELAREVSQGPQRRLDAVARLLDDAASQVTGPGGDGLTEVVDELRNARAELRNFAQGIRPLALSAGGLAAAVPLLAQRLSMPVTVSVDVDRLPPAVEAAAYFVCSEALTNVTKHASAASASIVIGRTDRQVVVEISDDGIGGADPSRGSGLRGLADRVEALAGAVTVERPESGGTRVRAVIPTQPGRPE
ncbi:MAG: histidine kinase, partial [Actinomycetota bacterium]|nr:histidine kinase [Actinomycetota bacterium]